MPGQHSDSGKITTFLNENSWECFCDNCIAQVTGVPVDEADPTVHPLAEAAEFERKFGQICSRCGRRRTCTKSLGPVIG